MSGNHSSSSDAEYADPTSNRRDECGLIRFAYRPFDYRWLYWDKHAALLDRPRADYRPHVSEGNLWLSAAQHLRKGASEPQTCFTGRMSSLHLIERGANMFPLWLSDNVIGNLGGSSDKLTNLSAAAEKYLKAIGATAEDLFHHVLAILHDPAYRKANAGALRMEWPRIPLPAWPQGNTARTLAESAARGRKIARLLDPETPVPGVTQGALRPEIATIAVPATKDDRNMNGSDYEITAGWGHHGTAQAVMPGQGRATEREYTPEERAALKDFLPALGDSTYDIHLNANAYWRNVPAPVWTYKLGGYQVLKKWLSYREKSILQRPLTVEEAQHFTNTARRITALLSLTEC